MRRTLALASLLVFAFVACGDKSGGSATLNKALTAHAQGKTEEAVKLYRQVLADDPNNKYALYNLGQIAQKAGDLAEAERDYQSALESDANFAPALFNLAILRTTQKRNDEAIALYQRLLKVQPRNANAHLNLGFLLKQTGHKAEGDAELKKAVELDKTLSKRIPSSPTPQPVATPKR